MRKQTRRQFLRQTDRSPYTGITKDVSRRCEQHNAGTASRYTRSRLPVSLEYQEAQATQSLALKREAAIKAMSRQEKELLMRSDTSSKPARPTCFTSNGPRSRGSDEDFR